MPSWIYWGYTLNPEHITIYGINKCKLLLWQGAMRMLHLPSPRLTPSPALTHSPMSPADQHATRSLSSNDTSYHLHDGQSFPPYALACHNFLLCNNHCCAPSVRTLILSKRTMPGC